MDNVHTNPKSECYLCTVQISAVSFLISAFLFCLDLASRSKLKTETRQAFAVWLLKVISTSSCIEVWVKMKRQPTCHIETIHTVFWPRQTSSRFLWGTLQTWGCLSQWFFRVFSAFPPLLQCTCPSAKFLISSSSEITEGGTVRANKEGGEVKAIHVLAVKKRIQISSMMLYFWLVCSWGENI